MVEFQLNKEVISYFSKVQTMSYTNNETSHPFYSWRTSRWMWNVCVMLLSMVCPALHTWGRCWRGGRFVIRIFAKGLVLSQDCPKPLKWHTPSFQMSLKNTHISMSHTMYNRKICRYVGEWTRLCVGYGGLLHLNMLIILLPGVVGRAYHWQARKYFTSMRV